MPLVRRHHRNIDTLRFTLFSLRREFALFFLKMACVALGVIALALLVSDIFTLYGHAAWLSKVLSQHPWWTFSYDFIKDPMVQRYCQVATTAVVDVFFGLACYSFIKAFVQVLYYRFFYCNDTPPKSIERNYSTTAKVKIIFSMVRSHIFDKTKKNKWFFGTWGTAARLNLGTYDKKEAGEIPRVMLDIYRKIMHAEQQSNDKGYTEKALAEIHDLAMQHATKQPYEWFHAYREHQFDTIQDLQIIAKWTDPAYRSNRSNLESEASPIIQ